MLINFFLTLRKYKVPVSIRELMDLLAGLKEHLVYANVDDFYLLSRTAMVKDEKNYDKFDRAFSAYFKGLEDLHGLLESLIPDEWLRHEFEKSLSKEELEQIESLGGLEKLIEAFKEKTPLILKDSWDDFKTTRYFGVVNLHTKKLLPIRFYCIHSLKTALSIS